MRVVFRTIGWLFTAVAVLLIIAGLASFPTGGLMFALPFAFLVPGVVLGAIGGALLYFTRAGG